MLWLKIKPLRLDDRDHLPIRELLEWMASYVYPPKVRDRVVVKTALREAISKLDAPFGYAESFDPATATSTYRGLIYAKAAPTMFGADALLVSEPAALAQLSKEGAARPGAGGGRPIASGAPASPDDTARSLAMEERDRKPRRFFGSVELDVNRPVRNFDAIIREVVDQLARAEGVKLRLTLEIEAETQRGFEESDVGVVRDNVNQLNFNPGATGFADH